MSDLVNSYLEIVEDARRVADDPKTIEAFSELLATRSELLQVLDELGSDPKSKVVRNNISRVEERLTELDGNAFTGYAADTLPQFDLKDLDDDAITHYFVLLTRYHSTGNGHFVLEVFVNCVFNGISPPKWVLEYLAPAFARYAFSDRQDTSVLLKALRLVGDASGSTSPWSEREGVDRDFRMAMDMATLIRWFGLSLNNAAHCVILKYDLSASPSTVKRHFKKAFGHIRGGMTSTADDQDLHTLTEVRRTQFFDGFPPKAKTIIRKGSSR